MPVGTRKFEPAAPVRSVTTDGQGAVVSLLEKDDRRFLVVVNRDISSPMPVEVRFDANAVVRAVGKDGTPHDTGATHQSQVGPGDAAIFTWAKS